MITSPSYFSKRALNGTPLDREPQAGADITPCQSFGQWQSTLEGMTPGQLLAQWRAALDANTADLVPQAISGIRVYERYFYLSAPTLLTP